MTLIARKCDDRYRVYRTDWSSGMFEELSEEELTQLELEISLANSGLLGRFAGFSLRRL